MRAGGYAIVDISMAIAVSAAIAVGVLANIRGQQRAAQFGAALDEAKHLLRTLEVYQREVTSSTVTGGVYSYTYATQATFVNASTYAASWPSNIATTTPWGTNYQVRATGAASAQVKFNVPASAAINPSGYTDLQVVSDGAGGWDVTISDQLTVATPTKNFRVLHSKAYFYQEAVK